MTSAAEVAAAAGGPASFNSRQQIIQHVKLPLLYTPMDCKWVPQSAVVTVVGQHPNNNGALCFYQLHHGELRSQLELRFQTPLKCCTYGHNYVTAATGTGDGHSSTTSASTSFQQPSPSIAVGDFVGGVHIWDVERLLSSGFTQSYPQFTKPNHRDLCDPELLASEGCELFRVPRAHESIINCIDGARFSGPPEIATGSRDGSCKIWDTRQRTKPVVDLHPVSASTARDCWTVRFGNCFDPDERVLCAGFDNGDVKLFDLRTQKMLHEMNVGNGVCDVEFDRADIKMNKLIVSMLEGKVRISDLRTLHPKLGYAYVEERVSDGTIWTSKSLPQNREVFVSGGGGELGLCQYSYPPERSLRDPDGTSRGVPGSITVHNKGKIGDQPINAVDWNRGKEGLLAATSFDQCLRVMLVTKLNLLQ
eukprot:gene12330-8458_t